MRTVTARRRLTVIVLGLITAMVGLGATAAASSAATTTRTWQVLVGAQSGDEAIQTMGFYPSNLTIDQGDTVTWVANSAEIHTVTFPATAAGSACAPAGPFDPTDFCQVQVQGGSTYDGSSYYNSGILTNATGDTGPLPPFAQIETSYSLTFPTAGTYHYLCLVHGQMMWGQVTVQAAGAPYPEDQSAYDRASREQIRADLQDGRQLFAHAHNTAAMLSKENGHPTVVVGAMDERAMVMRFIVADQDVAVGEQVTFVATSMGEPHTVTFGDDMTGCGAPPCNPEQPWNVALAPDGNEVANYPGSNGGFTGDPTALNSGLLLNLPAPPSITHVPSTLTVTFTQAGTFTYECALHDYMGMVGTVTVTG